MGMLSRILGPPSGAVYDRDPMFGAIQLSCWGVGTRRGCPRLAEEFACQTEIWAGSRTLGSTCGGTCLTLNPYPETYP